MLAWMKTGRGKISKHNIARHAQLIASDSRIEEAINDLKAALKRDPRDATTFSRLGYLHQLKMDFTSAIEYFLASAKLDLQHEYGKHSAAFCYKQVLKLDDSRADIQRALHEIYDQEGIDYISDRDMIQWLTAMRLLEDEGRLSEAIHLTELLLKQDPQHPELLIKLTELYLKVGDRERGNIYFRQAAYQLMERRMSPRTAVLLTKLGEANPYNHVPPEELIRILIEWTKTIKDFIIDYFPNKDPWENERDMGWIDVEEIQERYFNRLKRFLEEGTTPLEAFRKIKALIEENERKYTEHVRKIREQEGRLIQGMN